MTLLLKPPSSSVSSTAVLAIVLGTLMTVSAVHGQTWQGAPGRLGSWHDASNWMPGIPGSDSSFSIANRGSAEVGEPGAVALSGTVKNDSQLRFSGGASVMQGLGLGDAFEGTTGTLDVHGGTLDVYTMIVVNGSLLLGDGRIDNYSLSLGRPNEVGQPRYFQSGGRLNTAEFEIGSSESAWELAGGTFEANRLVVDSGITGPLQQTGGKLYVNYLDVGSRLQLLDGTTTVRHGLTIGETGRIEFGDQQNTIIAGFGSHVIANSTHAFGNAHNGRIHMGSDSIVLLHPNSDLDSLPTFGGQPAFGVVNEPLHIPTRQRAQLGNTDGQLTSLWEDLRVEGFAYNSAARVGGSRIFNPRVLSGGEIRNAEVTIRGDASEVIDGRLTNVEISMTGPASQWEVRRGTVDASQFIVRGGFLDPAVVELTDSNLHVENVLDLTDAELHQTGGTSRIGELLISLGSKSSLVKLTDATLDADYIHMRLAAEVDQSGGSVSANRLQLERGRYRMNGGELVVESALNYLHEDFAFDMMHSGATIRIDGGIVTVYPAQFKFENAENATMEIDEHSLLLLPEGSQFEPPIGNLRNAALIGRLGGDVVIPSNRSIHGSGILPASYLRVRGELIGEAHLDGRSADGLELGSFALSEGGKIEIPRGSITTTADSFVRGGQVSVPYLRITPDSTLLQSAGTIVTSNMFIDGTFRQSGGSLEIESSAQGSGTLDLTKSPTNLRLSSGASLDLSGMKVTGVASSVFVGESGSLVMLAPNDRQLTEQFGSFETQGLIHIQGETLEVPASKTLHIPSGFNGSIVNDGIVIVRGSNDMLLSEFQQSTDGMLSLVNAKDFDVQGMAVLDGTLSVELMDSFILKVGERRTLLNAVGIEGTFSEVILPLTYPGLSYQLTYGSQHLHLALLPSEVTGGPIAGDFDRNGLLDADDIDQLGQVVRGAYQIQFDMNGDGLLDQHDQSMWVNDAAGTFHGDANLDGEFNSSDLVQAFRSGEYEDGVLENSSWSTGDWNGDLEFGSGDFVIAFQSGGYEQGAPMRTLTVPEPNSLFLLLGPTLGYVGFCLRRKFSSGRCRSRRLPVSQSSGTSGSPPAADLFYRLSWGRSFFNRFLLPAGAAIATRQQRRGFLANRVG